MSKDFASLPEARVILPKSPVEIGGPMWKRHTPSYYLAELIAALRGAGMLEGKLGAGPPPDWFPSDNWSWRTFKNSLSGSIKRKTDICESILRFWGFEPSKHNLATDGGREGGSSYPFWCSMSTKRGWPVTDRYSAAQHSTPVIHLSRQNSDSPAVLHSDMAG